MQKDLIKKILITTAISGTSALLLNLLVIIGYQYAWSASLTLLSPNDLTPRTMPLVRIIPESFIVSFIASLVYFALTKTVKHAYRVFVIVVVFVTMLWTLGPLSHGVGLSTKIALSMTHFIIAFAILVTVRYVFIKDAAQLD